MVDKSGYCDVHKLYYCDCYRPTEKEEAMGPDLERQCKGSCMTKAELKHGDQVRHIMLRHAGEIAVLKEEIRRLNEFVVFAQMVDASNLLDRGGPFRTMLNDALQDMLVAYRQHEMEKENEEFDGLGLA